MMKYPASLPAVTSRRNRATVTLALVAATSITLANAAFAQTFRTSQPAPTATIRVEGSAQTTDLVQVLIGLAWVEADLQIGNLLLQEGDTKEAKEHFTAALQESFPEISDALVAAGAASPEEAMTALVAGGDASAMAKAYQIATVALLKAGAKLHPTHTDIANAAIEETKAAADHVAASGTTKVEDYHHAWAMLIVARKSVDLVLRSDDPAQAKAAQDAALAFDSVILSLPDPHASAPVDVDQAAILDLIVKLQAMGGST